MRTLCSKTLHTSTGKRSFWLAGGFAMFSPSGAGGWANTRLSCRPSYRTWTEASVKEPRRVDAAPKLWPRSQLDLRLLTATKPMLLYACYTYYCFLAVTVHFGASRESRGSEMNEKNAATRQDVIANSVDREIFTLANSAVSPEQMETLLAAELDHDVLVWPRQYLETYLDSDVTGRVPLDAEQLQDLLEAAFDRDVALALEYLEELKSESGPLRLRQSTLEVISVRSDEQRHEYELLFDPRDGQDLRYLIEKVDVRT